MSNLRIIIVSVFNFRSFYQIFVYSKSLFSLQFDSEKIGDEQVVNIFQKKLEHNLLEFRAKVCTQLSQYEHITKIYSYQMETSLERLPYLGLSEFMDIHNGANDVNVPRVCLSIHWMKFEYFYIKVEFFFEQFKLERNSGEVGILIQDKFNKCIEERFASFEEQNKQKRDDFRVISLHSIEIEWQRSIIGISF